jgi:hypothetical protein
MGPMGSSLQRLSKQPFLGYAKTSHGQHMFKLLSAEIRVLGRGKNSRAFGVEFMNKVTGS